MFPEQWHLDLSTWFNDVVEQWVLTYGDQFSAFSNGLLGFLTAIEGVLRGTPFWLVMAVVFGAAYASSRSLLKSFALLSLLFFLGVVGLWDQAMQTLALMLLATSFSVLLGVPLGVLLAQLQRTRQIFGLILDAMQTLPSFVYLIPAIMLFGLGKVPAILATVIYALPPVVRLTDLGLRLVDQRLVEAGEVFGAGRVRRLVDIEVPLALPNILQGINQTTMMALSMVVIASMIGARGLGEQVLLGIQRLDVGQGLTAGLAIVALAILLDRMTQSLHQRKGQASRA